MVSGTLLNFGKGQLISKWFFGTKQNSKAMKSSPLLGPFCGSEFWGFFSVENIARLGGFMFQTSDNSQLCIDSQYSSQ